MPSFLSFLPSDRAFPLSQLIVTMKLGVPVSASQGGVTVLSIFVGLLVVTLLVYIRYVLDFWVGGRLTHAGQGGEKQD